MHLTWVDYVMEPSRDIINAFSSLGHSCNHAYFSVWKKTTQLDEYKMLYNIPLPFTKNLIN